MVGEVRHRIEAMVHSLDAHVGLDPAMWTRGPPTRFVSGQFPLTQVTGVPLTLTVPVRGMATPRLR